MIGEKSSKVRTDSIFASKQRLRFRFGLTEAVFELFLVILFVYFVKDRQAVSDSVIRALKICVFRLAPSLFPFIVLIGMLKNSRIQEKTADLFGAAFSRLFGIGRAGVSAFIIGAVGGFPSGAVAARELYSCRKISKSEAARLCALANNAGYAFCVGGIGAAFSENDGIGREIYFCQLLAAVALGIIMRPRESENCDEPCHADRRRKSLSAIASELCSAVTSGGVTMLKISFFVCFFAVVGDFAVETVGQRCGSIAGAVTASLCELTLASRVCGEYGFGGLCAFAAGFGGLSVHMQIASVLEGSGISMKDCFKTKLFQGLLSAMLFAAFEFIKKTARI